MMPDGYQNMTMTTLVDLLAQKTQIFTQLMTDKKFGEEYEEYKETIQRIISEIEFRKENKITNPEPYLQ